MVRVVSSVVSNPETSDTGRVQEQWPAENGQSFSQQHPLMLLLHTKSCTLQDVSCTPVLPVAPGITPPLPPGSGYCSLSGSPSQVQLSCACHRENTETGTWRQERTVEHTLLKNIHCMFLSCTPRILSEVALLGETSRYCFNQLERMIFYCPDNWESFLLNRLEYYIQPWISQPWIFLAKS